MVMYRPMQTDTRPIHSFIPLDATESAKVANFLTPAQLLIALLSTNSALTFRDCGRNYL